ncbi:MAG: hypothetical protein KDD69_11555 [Bdellovibrionales bacterium]|nr:hypothetical protein [Bdellovibrionales bacterium]
MKRVVQVLEGGIKAYFALALTFGVPFLVHAEDATRFEAGGASTVDASSGVVRAKNQILRITPAGLEPPVIELERMGSSVFFFNDTDSEAIALEIDYGRKPGYCASGAMAMGEDGVFRSKEPVAAQQFVAVCFPTPGAYPLVSKTLTPTGEVQKVREGKVIVK